MKAVPWTEVLIGDMSGRFELVAALFGERQADQAAAEFRHEVDGFGRDLFGGHGEVAFVFAVFVVDQDDHAALANFFDGFFDGAEGVEGRIHWRFFLFQYTQRRGLGRPPSLVNTLHAVKGWPVNESGEPEAIGNC